MNKLMTKAFAYTFKGNTYYAREIDVPGIGKELVSCKSFEDALVKDGEHVSEEARCLDDDIFFFADDDKFTSLNDDELARHVSKEVSC